MAQFAPGEAKALYGDAALFYAVTWTRYPANPPRRGAPAER